jgi:hypothetical protein
MPGSVDTHGRTPKTAVLPHTIRIRCSHLLVTCARKFSETEARALAEAAVPVGAACETCDSGGERQLSQRSHCSMIMMASEDACARCPPCIRGQVVNTINGSYVIRSQLAGRRRTSPISLTSFWQSTSVKEELFSPIQ